jgi:PDZ domain-containing protein
MLPPPAPPALGALRAASRRRRWPFVLAAVGLLGPAAMVVASGITKGSYAITPGEASPTSPRIKVTKATSYDDTKGTVLFVTVGVPRLNALSEQIAKRDKQNEIVPARSILGDKTPDQNRKENLQLMGYSKDFASYVALSRLGYKVELSGGGSVVDSTCLEFEADGRTCKTEGPQSKVLHKDDVIVSLDGQPVHVSADISVILKSHQPGDVVKVTVKRGGEPQPLDLSVTLVESSDESGKRTIIGFIPNDAPPADLKFSFPIDIGIDSGQVGGPSAGLAFTLALLDKLTPGDLIGGHKIAATGTMSPSALVGDIGGIRQKTVAVERAGADVFLVPINEADQATAQAKGSNLKIIGVRDLDDALVALRQLGGNVDALTARTS